MSKLRNSSVHRSIASVGVIESDIKCLHSSGAGEGRDPGPGDKTLPLESRLRYTSGGHYRILLLSVSVAILWGKLRVKGKLLLPVFRLLPPPHAHGHLQGRRLQPAAQLQHLRQPQHQGRPGEIFCEISLTALIMIIISNYICAGDPRGPRVQ